MYLEPFAENTGIGLMICNSIPCKSDDELGLSGSAK
jgi:hypothetical protein